MKAPAVPTISSDRSSTILMFFIITSMFFSIMVLVGFSFNFVKKPIENEPEIIKKFTTQYLLIFNEVLILYIYFIFLCFILKDSILGGVVKFLFIFVTMALSFIVMVAASDAHKKITALSSVNYKAYTDFLLVLIGVSVVLLFLCIVWIYLHLPKKTSTPTAPTANVKQQQKAKVAQAPKV